MKKNFFVLTVLLISNIAIAQRDSTNLKRSVGSHCDELLTYKDKEINDLKNALSKCEKDSINLKAKETKNQLELKTLKTNNEKLGIEITNLQKNKLAQKNESLEMEIDKLEQDTARLNQVVKQKDATIQKEKAHILENQTTLKAEFYNNLSKEVGNFYIDNSIDFLVANCTQQSIENDKKHLKQSSEINNKLAAINEYYKAKQLLNKRFDQVSAKNQVEILKKFQLNSDSIKKTVAVLENYSFENQNLRDLIITIIEIDKQEGNSNEDFDLHKLKFQKISALCVTFLIDNNSLNDYPYLKNTMTEIMKLKKDNADTPIDQYLKRL